MIAALATFADPSWGAPPPAPEEAPDELATSLAEVAVAGSIPGLAAAVLVDGRLRWSGAVGQADVREQRRMTVDTIHNVGSVSKLVTATAVALLWEEGRLDLDADVGRYLPFPVRNPAAPAQAITARQLLTHTASIADGPAYGDSYACGDPTVSPAEWIEGYLLPGGRFWSEANFLPEGPGARFEYSNVGYGLLGYVVERITGTAFTDFTAREIFAPLGMRSTAWALAAVDRERLATPYWLATPGEQPDADEASLLPAGPFAEGELVPFCLYSFPNYPDGLLRTTIEELAAFVAATQPGPTSGAPLLAPSTRDEVFRNHLGEAATDDRYQGLGWRRTESERFGTLWGHGGADPGTRAHVLHRPADGVTVLVIADRLVGAELTPALELLLAAGARWAGPEKPTSTEGE